MKIFIFIFTPNFNEAYWCRKLFLRMDNFKLPKMLFVNVTKPHRYSTKCCKFHTKPIVINAFVRSSKVNPHLPSSAIAFEVELYSIDPTSFDLLNQHLSVE